jgi:hypothetical protein
VNEGISCYHEAGHAVMLWHYGIPFEYVTMRPPVGSSHRGQTVMGDRPEIGGPADLEIEMQVAAAGEIAATRVFTTKKVPTDDELIRAFARAAAQVTDNPDHSIEDQLIFAKTGLARDEEIHNAAPRAPVGPANWLPIWRQAEDLIRTELWPAVHAVAEELRRTARDLDCKEIGVLATAAMTGQEA